jgi:hypothetical protein
MYRTILISLLLLIGITADYCLPQLTRHLPPKNPPHLVNAVPAQLPLFTIRPDRFQFYLTDDPYLARASAIVTEMRQTNPHLPSTQKKIRAWRKEFDQNPGLEAAVLFLLKFINQAPIIDYGAEWLKPRPQPTRHRFMI